MEGSKLHGTTVVVPGTNTVRLSAQKKVLTAPLSVKIDPAITASEADLQRQFDLAVKIQGRISQAHETVPPDPLSARGAAISSGTNFGGRMNLRRS